MLIVVNEIENFQIQHLLKLNIATNAPTPTTKPFQIQHLLKLNMVDITVKEYPENFKYNTC